MIAYETCVPYFLPTLIISLCNTNHIYRVCSKEEWNDKFIIGLLIIEIIVPSRVHTLRPDLTFSAHRILMLGWMHFL